MSGILEATPIMLTEAERTELEALARSTKTEFRLRQRARIVLLAADGTASGAIGRQVGCTTGTASKWRVRYALERAQGYRKFPNGRALTGRATITSGTAPRPVRCARSGDGKVTTAHKRRRRRIEFLD